MRASAGAWPETLRRDHGGSEGEIKNCGSMELQISREEDEFLKQGDCLGRERSSWSQQPRFPPEVPKSSSQCEREDGQGDLFFSVGEVGSPALSHDCFFRI